jgi:transcriptional regulator with XRE-family HTH domain
MSFEDFAAKLKARKEQQQSSEGEEMAPYDFGESYRIRAKMVGVLLRDARHKDGRTVEDCARLLRVAPAQVEAWEFGHDVPSLPQLELLAYYLNVPVSHFWGIETLEASASLQESKQPEYLTLRDRIIGAMLRQAREEAELTLEQLAEVTGLTAARIHSFELGESPAPIHELSVLASGVNKNISYFLETDSQIGHLLSILEAWKQFSELPEEVRNFASDPLNVGFIHIAVMLSQMPTDKLRQVGASILDITM